MHTFHCYDACLCVLSFLSIYLLLVFLFAYLALENYNLHNSSYCFGTPYFVHCRFFDFVYWMILIDDHRGGCKLFANVFQNLKYRMKFKEHKFILIEHNINNPIDSKCKYLQFQSMSVVKSASKVFCCLFSEIMDKTSNFKKISIYLKNMNEIKK